jgi:hypothetical protein
MESVRKLGIHNGTARKSSWGIEDSSAALSAVIF